MKNTVRSLLLPLGDIAMLVLAFFAMLEVAFYGGLDSGIIDSHLDPFIFVFILWLLVFFLFNLYDARLIKPTIPNLRKIGAASTISLSLSVVLFYAVSAFGITPKTNLVIFSVIFVGLFIIWRRIFYNIFSMNFRKSVVFIVEEGKEDVYVKELINYMENYPESGYRVLDSYKSLEGFIEKEGGRKIDTLIISKSALEKNPNIGLIYNTIESVFDLAYAYEDILGKVPVDLIDETWFLYNIRTVALNYMEKVFYIFSVILIIPILVILCPIVIVTAIAIKLEDGGKIFYTQMRVGKNGKVFRFYKFRSMVMSAENDGIEWTERNDPRITKVGKIIRKLHIDEIPQFLNILKGDMALVGPRPEIPSFEEKLGKEIRHYGIRNIILPGFTGWAQIKFRKARGVAESKEKFEYDLYYIKNRNIFMDLGIILRTVIIIFTHD